MKEYRYLTELLDRYPLLKREEASIWAAYELLRQSYEQEGKLLIAGNGGSCADAEHIVGELMKGFVKRRPVKKGLREKLVSVGGAEGNALADSLQRGLPAISLSSHTGLFTAFLNDVNGEMVYAQQILGYGRTGDVFLGISTSGNSENIRLAAMMAKAKGMKVIGLLGRDGGRLCPLCDAAIIVPEQETFKIQELHLPVYHALCLMLEEHFFG